MADRQFSASSRTQAANPDGAAPSAGGEVLSRWRERVLNYLLRGAALAGLRLLPAAKRGIHGQKRDVFTGGKRLTGEWRRVEALHTGQVRCGQQRNGESKRNPVRHKPGTHLPRWQQSLFYDAWLPMTRCCFLGCTRRPAGGFREG